jgi:hypothetical protein
MRSNEAALHRNALKMYSFLLSWLVTIGEKGSKQEHQSSKGRVRTSSQRDGCAQIAHANAHSFTGQESG